MLFRSISTFASRYKAVNDQLAKNVGRFNATANFENELQGTLQNFAPVADAATSGNIKPANVMELVIKGTTNDPDVNQYSFQIEQMRSELAGYNAALRGEAEPDQMDYAAAANIIKDGLSKKGSTGFSKAVAASTNKMGGVLQQNINRTNKQVWDLFGVGEHYKPPAAPGGAAPAPSAPGAGGNATPTISSAADYNALAKGTTYIDPQGHTRTKP